MFLIKKLILPLGLLIALSISLFLPGPGIFCKEHFGVELTVIAIFIVSGFIHKFNEVKFGRDFIFLIILAISSNLLILPFIGLFFAGIFLPAAFAVGIIVIVSMPPTLSSGVVITEVADGNSVLAILLTIILNLTGLLTVPFVIGLIFDDASSVHVSPYKLFFKLFFIVFLPFIFGRFIKKFVSFAEWTEYIKLISPVSVIAAVWMCFSASSDGIYELKFLSVAKLVLAALAIHILFLLFNFLITFLFKLPKKDVEAFIFVTSQKTMPLAILVLSTISNKISAGVIACVIYHFMQILFDSILATFISKRKGNNSINT